MNFAEFFPKNFIFKSNIFLEIVFSLYSRINLNIYLLFNYLSKYLLIFHYLLKLFNFLKVGINAREIEILLIYTKKKKTEIIALILIQFLFKN